MGLGFDPAIVNGSPKGMGPKLINGLSEEINVDLAFETSAGTKNAKSTLIEDLTLTSTRVTSTADDSTSRTMEENEREYIISVLNKCGWKISGKGGAAEILDIKSSTPYSRIKKLGIEKKITLK